MKVEQDQQRDKKTTRSHRTSFPKQRGGSGKEQQHSSTKQGGGGDKPRPEDTLRPRGRESLTTNLISV